jgi:hypothetical protein
VPQRDMADYSLNFGLGLILQVQNQLELFKPAIVADGGWKSGYVFSLLNFTARFTPFITAIIFYP